MTKGALNSIYNPEPIKCTVPIEPLFISVPYLGKDSFLLKRKLTSLIGRFYPQFKIICCFKSSFTIGSMFKFKDKLPHLLIYQYSCRQCSSSYVGQTVKQFKVRISQHQGRSYRTGNYLTSPENSKILKHSLDSGHPIVENDFKILDCCDNLDIRTLERLESLYIHKLKPSLNDQHSSTDLFIDRYFILNLFFY